MMVIFLRGTPVSVSSWQEIDSDDIYFVIHDMYNANHIKIDTSHGKNAYIFLHL